MKLKIQVEQIRRRAPKGPTKFGQLYSVAADTKARFKKITLYTLFASEENTHMIRPHVFSRKHGARSAAEWSAWFGELVDENGRLEGAREEQRLTYIHRRSILPGLQIRTSKQWAVQRIIGWVGNASSKARDSKSSKRRNKTKSKRR